MATRTTYKSATAGAITGDDYMDQTGGHIDTLYDASVLLLTTIGGTADAVTAVVDPVLPSGLVAGMSFWFEPTADNTGAMTMVIGAESAVAIKRSDGAASEAGDLLNGSSYQLFYTGTELRVVSASPPLTTGSIIVHDVHTASGTSTKPAAFPDTGLIRVRMWGGGGGGRGGGGGYSEKWFVGSDHAATETATVGTGGAVGFAGGTTSLGALLTAYGGGRGNGGGGGGGGQLSVGVDGAAGTTAAGGAGGSPSNGSAGASGGGNGGDGNTGGGGGKQFSGADGNGGDGIFGGGGGSGGSGGGENGGNSIYGGGGGGGDTGGLSVHGGAGGATTVAGSIPGGGGGGSAAGARGEIRITWIS